MSLGRSRRYTYFTLGWRRLPSAPPTAHNQMGDQGSGGSSGGGQSDEGRHATLPGQLTAHPALPTALGPTTLSAEQGEQS